MCCPRRLSTCGFELRGMSIKHTKALYITTGETAGLENEIDQVRASALVCLSLFSFEKRVLQLMQMLCWTYVWFCLLSEFIRGSSYSSLSSKSQEATHTIMYNPPRMFSPILCIHG